MNRRFWIFPMIYFSFIPAFNNLLSAQESPENILGIYFGLNNMHIYDEHAEFLNYRGTGITPALTFDHNSGKNSHNIEGTFYYNNLTSSNDGYKTRILSGQIRYTFSRTLVNTTFFEKPFDLSAGLSFSSYFMKSDYQFYNRTFWQKSIESWYGTHSLEAALNLRYTPGEKNSFIVSFFLPIISNVSRPAYSASGDYNYEKNDWDVKLFGKTMVIPENMAINAHVSYLRRLSGKICLNAGYEFYYAKCRQPDPLRMYMNNLRLGILYNL